MKQAFYGKSIPTLLKEKEITYEELQKWPRGKRRKFKRRNPDYYMHIYWEFFGNKEYAKLLEMPLLILPLSKHKKRAKNRSATRKPDISNNSRRPRKGIGKG